MKTMTGGWLTGLGAAVCVAAFCVPACSSSSSGGGAAGDGGSKSDGTSSSSGSSSGSASSSGGGSSSGSASSSGAGSSSGSSSGSGGTDASTCPAVPPAAFTDTPTYQCAVQDCCSQFTACAGSSDCAAVAACFVACQVDGGTGGSGCRTQCEANASTAAKSGFDAAFTCVNTNCANAKGDGGGD
jgi:hypothetical protein